jgi:hypothetical protein
VLGIFGKHLYGAWKFWLTPKQCSEILVNTKTVLGNYGK